MYHQHIRPLEYKMVYLPLDKVARDDMCISLVYYRMGYTIYHMGNSHVTSDMKLATHQVLPGIVFLFTKHMYICRQSLYLPFCLVHT